MSRISAETAWQRAEERCFDWLCDITDVTANEGGFIAEMPPAFNVWYFAINGGPSPFQSWGVNDQAKVSWRMNADFVGRYAERSEAQRIAGLLRENLPAKGAIQEVDAMRMTEEPTIVRELVQLANDAEPQRFWLLTQPLEVVFRNTAN